MECLTQLFDSISLYRLAELVDEIDLILGGHDHVYEKKMVRKSNDKSLQSILPT